MLETNETLSRLVGRLNQVIIKVDDRDRYFKSNYRSRELGKIQSKLAESVARLKIERVLPEFDGCEMLKASELGQEYTIVTRNGNPVALTDGREVTEYDGLVLVDGLPVIVETFATHRDRIRRGVSTEWLNKKTVPLTSIFGCTPGMILFLPSDQYRHQETLSHFQEYGAHVTTLGYDTQSLRLSAGVLAYPR